MSSEWLACVLPGRSYRSRYEPLLRLVRKDQPQSIRGCASSYPGNSLFPGRENVTTNEKMMKKITILKAILALMMFSALPVLADENTSEQYIYDSQNAYVDINGNDNSVASTSRFHRAPSALSITTTTTPCGCTTHIGDGRWSASKLRREPRTILEKEGRRPSFFFVPS